MKGGDQKPKESGNAPREVEFSEELHPALYLVGLLPAASLSVHVYGILCPVSLQVQLLSNLWLTEVDTKGREQELKQPAGGRTNLSGGGGEQGRPLVCNGEEKRAMVSHIFHCFGKKKTKTKKTPPAQTRMGTTQWQFKRMLHFCNTRQGYIGALLELRGKRAGDPLYRSGRGVCVTLE